MNIHPREMTASVYNYPLKVQHSIICTTNRIQLINKTKKKKKKKKKKGKINMASNLKILFVVQLFQKDLNIDSQPALTSINVGTRLPVL